MAQNSFQLFDRRKRFFARSQSLLHRWENQECVISFYDLICPHKASRSPRLTLLLPTPRRLLKAAPCRSVGCQSGQVSYTGPAFCSRPGGGDHGISQYSRAIDGVQMQCRYVSLFHRQRPLFQEHLKSIQMIGLSTRDRNRILSP